MAFQRTAIVLFTDGLGARALGPYGNSWYQTANFNRLAAQSTLCENAFASKPSDCGTGWNFLASLPPSIRASIRFVGDDMEVCDAASKHFDEIDQVVHEPVESAASDWTQTRLARFFSFAAEAISQLKAGQLLILHTRGMLDCWDSPRELRDPLAQDEDPTPPLTTDCPSLLLESDYDPDSLLGWQQVFGAQVHVLDLCLGILLDQLDELPCDRQPLLAVTAPRGFPLGEHLVLGHDHPILYDELIHVPFFVRTPNSIVSPARQHDLITPNQAFALAAAYVLDRLDQVDAFALPPLPNRKRQFLKSTNFGMSSIRTHAWKMIADETRRELYVMPDDRWEQNDVQDRCTDVIEQLDQILAEPINDTALHLVSKELSDTLAFGHS